MKKTRSLSRPVSIRVIGADLGERDRAHIRQKLGEKLAKAASSIERVSVRITDANGPRGGVDQVCRIKVVLAGVPSVVVDQRASALRRAIDSGIGRAERAVMSAVRRRRLKPRRDRTRRTARTATARS